LADPITATFCLGAATTLLGGVCFDFGFDKGLDLSPRRTASRFAGAVRCERFLSDPRCFMFCKNPSRGRPVCKIVHA
jgi:hypothetical protein